MRRRDFLIALASLPLVGRVVKSYPISTRLGMRVPESYGVYSKESACPRCGCMTMLRVPLEHSPPNNIGCEKCQHWDSMEAADVMFENWRGNS